jgi:hypothetical protein
MTYDTYLVEASNWKSRKLELYFSKFDSSTAVISTSSESPMTTHFFSLVGGR